MRASPFAQMVRQVLLASMQRLGATRPYKGTPDRLDGHKRGKLPGVAVHNRRCTPGRYRKKQLEIVRG
jgi:hypothetical protein